MGHWGLQLEEVWRDREPAIFSDAHKFLCWNDMLAVALGIDPGISPSLAARTGLYDLNRYYSQARPDVQ